MPRIKRLPYLADKHAFLRGESFSFSIWQFGPDDDYDRGLPIDLAFFIHLYCKCARCGASIARDLARCACGKPKNAHLIVNFPAAIYLGKFKAIRKREEGRVQKQSRKQWKQENGGTYTKEDVTNLYRLQQGLCYFCAVSISATKGANYFHIDHYQALSNGGTNDRFNIVLTCASCNRRKSNMHGDVFERRIRKTRDPALGRKLGKLRRKLTAFLGKRPKQVTYDSRRTLRKAMGLD